jgi:hypothetical protein
VDVAVKELHAGGIEARIEGLKEAAKMSALRHPCIVAFYGVVMDEGTCAP